MKSLQQILTAACHERDHPWALATLVATQGSTYRQPGARMLVSPGGETIGVLSGGCLEEEIAEHGLEVMRDGAPRLVSFDTRKLYGCEGRLGIYIEHIPAAEGEGNFLTRAAEKIAHRQLCRMRVDYGNHRSSELLPDKELVVERHGVFTHAIPLPVRLLLFGTGPEVAPMRLFAKGLGWLVADYAHPDELPPGFVPDPQTAAVVMTHKFGRDLAALDRLLPLGLGYIGLLGPKKRHAEMLARFQDFRELDPGWLSALHAPAGLDIGSESPEEIAFSIISEASAVLAGRRGGFLREKSAAIHLPEIQEARA